MNRRTTVFALFCAICWCRMSTIVSFYYVPSRTALKIITTNMASAHNNRLALSVNDDNNNTNNNNNNTPAATSSTATRKIPYDDESKGKDKGKGKGKSNNDNINSNKPRKRDLIRAWSKKHCNNPKSLLQWRLNLLKKVAQQDNLQQDVEEMLQEQVLPTTTTETPNVNDKKKIRQITSIEELDKIWDPIIDIKNPQAILSKLSVQGDTQTYIGSPDYPDHIHPVLKVLYEEKEKRRKQQQEQQEDITNNNNNNNDDSNKRKIALVVEGGGMRGCVTAGMVCAIDYLGLNDCFDVVYGSSAGSIIGAFFITKQLPWFGVETYYDQLTKDVAGKQFIDTSRLFRVLGLGLLHPKLIKDVIVRPNSGKPVLNLDYLLKDTLQNYKALDWKTFEEKNKSGRQPLKVMASAMKQEGPIVMDYENGHFTSLKELAQCMHASCLLPGIAGPVTNILGSNTTTSTKPKFVLRNNLKDDDYEPLADSLIYAPIPYDTARQQGATHMVVLRSKPDGGDVIGKGGSIGEKLTWSRFCLRKNKLPNIYNRLRQQRHKRLYAQNVLELNEAAAASTGSKTKSSLPPTLTVALPTDQEEIPRLEARREAIFEGVRQGFARAYDALVEDPAERGKGYEVAQKYFPDEILDYSPKEIMQKKLGNDELSSLSAFEIYLKESGVWPKAWEGLSEPPVKLSTEVKETRKE